MQRSGRRRPKAAPRGSRACRTVFDLAAHQLLSGFLFQRGLDHLLLEEARDNHNTIEVAEDEVAGLDEHTPDFNCAAEVGDGGADARILREAAAAEHGPVLLEDLWRVAVEAVEHSPGGAA